MSSTVAAVGVLVSVWTMGLRPTSAVGMFRRTQNVGLPCDGFEMVGIAARSNATQVIEFESGWYRSDE